MNSQKYGGLNKTCMMRIPAESQHRWGHLMMPDLRWGVTVDYCWKGRIPFSPGCESFQLQAVISRHICLQASLSGLSGLCMWLCAWMYTWVALIKEEVMSGRGNRGKGSWSRDKKMVKMIRREYSSMEFSNIKKAQLDPCLMMEWCQIKST